MQLILSLAFVLMMIVEKILRCRQSLGSQTNWATLNYWRKKFLLLSLILTLTQNYVVQLACRPDDRTLL